MQGRVAGRKDGEEDGGSGRARKGTGRRIESKDGGGGSLLGQRERMGSEDGVGCGMRVESGGDRAGNESELWKERR